MKRKLSMAEESLIIARKDSKGQGFVNRQATDSKSNPSCSRPQSLTAIRAL